MKLKLSSLLCAVLLPAALLAQNVDVGIEWAGPLPDTVAPGYVFFPAARCTNYTELPASGSVMLSVTDPYGVRIYSIVQPVLVPGLFAIVVSFPTLGPFLFPGDYVAACTLLMYNDTTPGNDTVWHCFHVRRPGVDVGVTWDPSMPDTIDSTWNVTLRARVTVYRLSGAINLDVFCRVWRGQYIVYEEVLGLLGFTGLDTVLTFPDMLGGFYPVVAACWVAVAHDTYPANDTAWWRPYLRGSAVEEPDQSTLLSAEPRTLSTHFSRSVIIRCRKPAPVLIYDACGSLVRTLAPAREVIWDGRDRFGRNAPVGVYSVCCGPNLSARVVKTR